ncbi:MULTISPECIES: D-aminoacyl-tRNA deacylase [unclassified Saccharopolyspora]|uniref:D-aminoacyl-tRNA deacylase n=1 Tax=unclassified Saccharopolyspora TaxID=2646250 RepID=UPI001CD3D8C6|nr:MULTISPECIES: D-aminoacyl-tRNA deacylase [unclassified Saccharopolyspora]MCA1186087.1 D-tyrosyl-tRNA(Tyr) deacylase [Saccharopolyspora sp. 6T]MCA1192418.1 D-tyrosyl-tRNA(Tyr) deacylase [Saccharopolyspora sp. 6V]MCA1224542.1 D-tyrosyl-tRNA(Tyr) deacylase [Saccharopolyspora sp. 6M]MCA1279013.1 D-tyrosyl-tRNA(Tyr) deacylase [Saccharopolyspora sp. 7B]
MRAVVSRVTRASVRVGGEAVGKIEEPGLLVLLGVTHSDGSEQAANMARKLHEMRALRDEESCATTGAPLLVVSQFTLYGSTRKGRRPSWTEAARPEQAEPLVSEVVERLRERGAQVATGRFGAMMEVDSVNDGPFTLLIDV